ncbi:MAG: AfsR/SARP family transcriptional regulator [Streptosporangiaceae bacterium]
MPNALRVGLLGSLQVRDEAGRPVHVGGRQLRVLLTLLALNAGRVVPAGSLAGQIWPDDPPGNPGNALQTLVSRLRAELRQAGIGDVIESHPAGYRLAVPPEAVDVMAFEALADVIDAIAVLTQDSAQPGRPGDLVNREERAKLAATLLGAAHSVRGCFDEGSLDAPAARESARSLLGPDEFEAAYERGRARSQDEAVALAAGVVSAAGISSADGLARSW